MKIYILILGTLLLSSNASSATLEQAERARSCNLPDKIIEHSVEMEPVIEVLQEEVVMYSIGEGPMVIYEFFDYNCPTCNLFANQFSRLAENPKVFQLNFVELGVFGRGSRYAAHTGLSLLKGHPEKYWEYHSQIFSTPGSANKSKAKKVLKQINIDPAVLEKISKSDLIETQRDENERHFDSLGLTATPGLIVDGIIIEINDKSGSYIGCLIKAKLEVSQ